MSVVESLRSAQYVATVDLDKTMIEFYDGLEGILLEEGLDEDGKPKHHIIKSAAHSMNDQLF